MRLLDLFQHMQPDREPRPNALVIEMWYSFQMI